VVCSHILALVRKVRKRKGVFTLWSYFILRVLPCALQVCEIVLHLEEQLTDYYEIETICYITYRVFSLKERLTSEV